MLEAAVLTGPRGVRWRARVGAFCGACDEPWVDPWVISPGSVPVAHHGAMDESARAVGVTAPLGGARSGSTRADC